MTKAELMGKCWCGCQEPTNGYWRAGHDRKAQQALLEMVYGEGMVADWLAQLGYGPDNIVIDSRDKLMKDRTR